MAATRKSPSRRSPPHSHRARRVHTARAACTPPAPPFHRYVALKALTGTKGDRLLCLSRNVKTSAWQCWTPKFSRHMQTGHPTARQLVESSWPDTGKRGSAARDSDSLLDLLLMFDEGKCIMCCGSGGHDDSDSSASGIVQGHAYALLKIVTNLGPKKDIDLLRLRNPHGQGGKEWSGRWSDGHPSWDRHPEIKEALRPANADDGTFWISRQDFCNEFRSISVCLSDECAAVRVPPNHARRSA